MRLSARSALVGLVPFGLLALLVTVGPPSAAPPAAAAPAAVHPLDRVPADAGLFAHFQAGDLWDHPMIADLRKTYAKEVAAGLNAIEQATGLRPEQVNSLTFHFPKFPAGPGDERLFILQVTTKKAYDKEGVLPGFRASKEMAKGDVVKLRDGMVLHLTSDTQFTVLHESMVEEFKKGPPKAADGLLSDALKAARAGKNALVVGLDPSQLPNEILTAAENEPTARPFLPLLKSRAVVLQANLDKDLTAEVRFVAEKEDQAVEAEQSFNLLMKLADDGLAGAIKNEKPSDDLKPLLPALTELQKVVQGVKAERQGLVTTAKASLKADSNLARPIVALLLRPFSSSARLQSTNNLKQIGLALHNYHDQAGIFPAAAIVDKKGKALLSWRVAILPYIEQENLYKQFKLDEPWDSEHNKKLLAIMPKIYALPYDATKPGTTHYRVFVGNSAAFDLVQGLRITQFTDGTSNTLLAVEAAEGVPWTKPEEIEFDPQKPMMKNLRFENNICNILMADGSVRAVTNKLAENTLRLLIQKDDGMPIGDID